MLLKNLKSNKSILRIAALFFVIVFSNQQVKAQNLQFSRVLIVSSSETVPVGKVWKVESLVSSETSAVNGNTRIRVDGTNRTVTDCDPNGRCVTFMQFPIWFPEGVSLEASSGVAGISVIEFTVAP